MKLTWKKLSAALSKMVGGVNGARTESLVKVPASPELLALRDEVRARERHLEDLQTRMQSSSLRAQEIRREIGDYDKALQSARTERVSVMRQYAEGTLAEASFTSRIEAIEARIRRIGLLGEINDAHEKSSGEIAKEVRDGTQRLASARMQYWLAVSAALAAGFRETGDLRLVKLSYAASTGLAGVNRGGWSSFVAWTLEPAIGYPRWEDEPELIEAVQRLYPIASDTDEERETTQAANDQTDPVQTSALDFGDGSNSASERVADPSIQPAVPALSASNG